ncbi:MAG: diguanylate cyclase, partial [Burkholderiales bacterium]
MCGFSARSRAGACTILHRCRRCPIFPPRSFSPNFRPRRSATSMSGSRKTPGPIGPPCWPAKFRWPSSCPRTAASPSPTTTPTTSITCCGAASKSPKPVTPKPERVAARLWRRVTAIKRFCRQGEQALGYPAPGTRGEPPCKSPKFTTSTQSSSENVKTSGLGDLRALATAKSPSSPTDSRRNRIRAAWQRRVGSSRAHRQTKRTLGREMGMLNVLVVDDSRTLRMGLAKMLQQMGHTVTMAENGEEGIEAFVAQRPGLILMDVSMPVLDGYETARRIRATFSDDWVPIIFLSGSEDDQDLERAIAAGGDDYLVKPVSYVVLSAKIQAMCRIEQMRQRLLALTRQLATANSELERLSRQDALTGLANRRFFDFSLAAELARARRAQHPLALLMCDVDHFKAYNDTYGHLAGDECLQRIARVLKESCRRTSDLAARYGGEEFSLVLPATPLDGAAILGEALRCAVRDLR